MGITEVLTVVFVVLKLVGTIDWSWWLVFLPEIIAFVFYLAIFIIEYVSRYRVSKYKTAISATGNKTELLL